MVQGGGSGSGGQTGSSSSSHSSSSSASSRGKGATRLLIRVSPLVPSDRIHSFFDRSLTLAKPPVGAGFVRKVSRKGDDTVVVSIEDALIANRLVSSFSDSRPKIDGHEFTIEFYSSDHSKSLSSPSNHNGDKRREKESTRMSGCSSSSSPSTRKRPPISSRSPSRPSTSTHDSTREECAPSSSSCPPLPMDPYHGIIGVAMHVLPFRESILKEILSVGLHEIGGYLTHFVDDSGRMKVLLKRSPSQETTPEGELVVQGADTPFTAMSMEETRKLYDLYLSSDKCRESIPSTSSSSSSPSVPSSESSTSRRRDALSYESSRTIFVPYLPKGTTKEDLRKKFHKIGAVLESELKNATSISPHAIVQFNHTLAAVMAMEEYEKEQREDESRDHSKRKRPHFIRSPSSHRVWVANLPPMDEDYVKKKLLELLKGANNPTIVVDLRRREGIIDLGSIEKAKHYLEIIKSTPVNQQGGSVHTWLVADYCSDALYDHFIQRRGLAPSAHEGQLVTTLSKMHPTREQKNQAEARMERMKGGEEKTTEKKRSMNGENGHHIHSPSSTRRLNGEDRRSGDSGFSEDREKNQVLDSDDDEMLERKWRVAAVPNDRKEENGKMRKKLMRLGEDMQLFYDEIPETPRVKKEVKEEEEGEKKENEKIPRHERINNFRDKLLSVSSPLKTRSLDEMMRYRPADPLKSPPIPISPLNGDCERKLIVSSPPSGSRPTPLHINIPPSTSTTHSNTTPSPYTRLPPTSSASSSRHPSISTPSTLTPRSQTMPSSSNRPPFPPDINGDHPWNYAGPANNVSTPTSSRLPLSRRESVCSNSSQSTPLPPALPSIGGVHTPSALKSPPVSTWNSTVNAWKGGPSLPSPVPSSVNRVRPSMDAHHKPSTPSQSRPATLPKNSMDKCGFPFGPSTSLPKTPLSLPRSSSMNEKKPNVNRDTESIVDHIIHSNNKPTLKMMKRIPKKENRERDEKEERKEKKREEKDRERREDRDERKEKKEDRKKSRENETKEEKARRKELKRKEREKEERKKSMNDKDKKRKSMDGEKKKKKKQKRHRSDSDDSDDSDENFKPSSSNSKQMMDDEALARSLAAGSSMYDRVKVRRSGSNKEEKKKIEALEAIKKKHEKKTKKRAMLSSDEEEEEKEREKKKREVVEEESSEDEVEEKERMKEEKKKKEKKRRESTDESESEDEREKNRMKKEKKVLKKSSAIDLFEDDDGDSVKSEKKEKLTKKRSHEKEEKGDFPCSSTHPPPEKKVKKEESSSCASESEGERSSKKSEVSTSSWRGKEEKGRRLSESSLATHSEKDEVWKSPASGSTEKEMKEEPKEDRPPPRLMTKAAMKEFNVGASSSPVASTWLNNRDVERLHLSSEDSSQSSSDSEEEKEEIEESKEEEEKREEKDEKEEKEEKEGGKEEEEKMEEESVEVKEEVNEEERIDEGKEDERMEEEKEEEVKKEEEEENHSMEKDEETERAIRGLELPSDDVIEETEKAVESIFDDEEEPEANYPEVFLKNDATMSSSSSQSSSPKITLPPLPRPIPLPTNSLLSPSILSPNHLQHLQPHPLPPIPPISSPLISPHIVSLSPCTSRPASNPFINLRPISQESSSQLLHDENALGEKSWTSQGSSSDGGPSPSPSQPAINKEQISKYLRHRWSGLLKMKTKTTATSWFYLHGDENLLENFFKSAPIALESEGMTNSAIEVNLKMRLVDEKIRELLSSMEGEEERVCLFVTPGGANHGDVLMNQDIFCSSFVHYFRKKEIAGISEFTHGNGLKYVAQFFSPGQFVTNYLSPKYLDLLQYLDAKHPDKFLLVLINRKEGT